MGLRPLSCWSAAQARRLEQVLERQLLFPQQVRDYIVVNLAAARTLAEVLVDVGAAFGRRVSVLFTRMDAPMWQPRLAAE